jgi:hypothetical protein
MIKEGGLRRIREARLGDRTLRLVEKDMLFIGIIISDGTIKAQIDGYNADDVWRQLHDEAAKANPRYFGFDGARARFLRFFPNGFHSDGYTNAERNYKVAAKAQLDDAVPLESAAMGSGLGEAILSVYRDTNLLSPFEKVRLQDVLRGPAGDPFVRSAARFTMGDKSALAEMEHTLRPHESAKWTVVTYLPFLWQPERHMFLKPEVTKDFAARVGHRFADAYKPQLDTAIYESLLDLAARMTTELADLKPRDRIDVQSFIWVVGDYKDETEQPKP